MDFPRGSFKLTKSEVITYWGGLLKFTTDVNRKVKGQLVTNTKNKKVYFIGVKIRDQFTESTNPMGIKDAIANVWGGLQ